MPKQAGNAAGSNGTTDERIRPPSLPAKKAHRENTGTERTFRDPQIGEMFGPTKSATEKLRP